MTSALRRYTNLASALHILRNRCLTLLSPTTWDDRNDAVFLSAYKSRRTAKTVLALCFAEASETYHHWRIFSHGTDGTCIEFDRESLEAAIAAEPSIQFRAVSYLRLDSVSNVELDDLPFTKRWPYHDECEQRMLYTNMSEEMPTKRVAINLECVRRVTLSPWMPAALADTVRETIREIPACGNLSVFRSTLIENERWMKVANPNLHEAT